MEIINGIGLESADSYVESSPVYPVRLEVGGVSVQIDGASLVARDLGPSLEPFCVEGGAVCDMRIHVEWVTGLTDRVGRKVFDSGTTWRLSETQDGFLFDFSAPVLGEQPYKRLIADRCFRRSSLQMNKELFADSPFVPSPLEYPLDELLIMHRLTQESAIELHGCGIVSEDGAGNLFVGHSGAGKSTTTRLWNSCRVVEILSDDRIIVRWDSSTRKREEESVVETPFGASGADAGKGILRLRDCSASRNSRFAQDDNAVITAQDDSTSITSQDDTTQGHMRMYGTPWHGETMFASPNSAPLTRILVLEHGHGNVLNPLSRSQAVAELFARSFVPMHRHEYVESALEFLQQVVESVPCYRYSFEPAASAVEKILNLHD